MAIFSSAFDVLLPGETGLFVSTDGTNLTIHEDGSGESGWWVMSPERHFDRVFIFKRGNAGSKPNEIFSGHCAEIEGPDEGRYNLHLTSIKFEGATSANWTAFALAGQNPVRFLERADSLPEEIPASTTYPEGAVRRITVNAYERNPKARLLCIAHYGTSCHLCGFDFGEVYGEAAEGLIHVHHLRPLSQIGAEYEVDPIEDLRPVCPNCHAVLHRRIPAFSLEDVQGFLGGRAVKAVIA